MKYTAKDSYKKLSDEKNYNAHWSAAKHKRLMNDEEVDITEVPKDLKTHLECVEKKLKKETK
mgnify:FL=1